eukprot:c27068_g2_i1 orf=3-383(-)
MQAVSRCSPLSNLHMAYSSGCALMQYSGELMHSQHPDNSILRKHASSTMQHEATKSRLSTYRVLPTRISGYGSTIATAVPSIVSKQSLLTVDIFALFCRDYHSKIVCLKVAIYWNIQRCHHIYYRCV